MSGCALSTGVMGLVESTLQHSLQGAAEVNFRPEGLVIEMHFLVDEPDAD